jgi:hypothetical protein
MREKLVFDEIFERGVAHIVTEREQSLCLRQRQTEIRHLDVLRANSIQNGGTDNWRVDRHKSSDANRRGALARRPNRDRPTP